MDNDYCRRCCPALDLHYEYQNQGTKPYYSLPCREFDNHGNRIYCRLHCEPWTSYGRLGLFRRKIQYPRSNLSVVFDFLVSAVYPGNRPVILPPPPLDRKQIVLHFQIRFVYFHLRGRNTKRIPLRRSYSLTLRRIFLFLLCRCPRQIPRRFR